MALHILERGLVLPRPRGDPTYLEAAAVTLYACGSCWLLQLLAVDAAEGRQPVETRCIRRRRFDAAAAVLHLLRGYDLVCGRGVCCLRERAPCVC